jgi:hypothetical protein
MKVEGITIVLLNVDGMTHARCCGLAVNFDLILDVIPFLFGCLIWVGRPFFPQGFDLCTRR